MQQPLRSPPYLYHHINSVWHKQVAVTYFIAESAETLSERLSSLLKPAQPVGYGAKTPNHVCLAPKSLLLSIKLVSCLHPYKQRLTYPHFTDGNLRYRQLTQNSQKNHQHVQQGTRVS